MTDPNGFPVPTGPQTWTGDQLAEDSWIIAASDSMVGELDRLLAEIEAQQLTIPFPVEAVTITEPVADLLGQVMDRLESGPGLALVRGLPRRRYTKDQFELLYWALGSHLGTPVSQNAKGHVLGHVRDLGLSLADPSVRVYQTNEALDYHSDKLPVDVLGVCCLETAPEGGESMVVSALAIHEVVRHERPDLLAELYQPFNLDWRDEEPEGQRPWYSLPMFSEAEGRISSRFTSLAYFRSVDRHGPELALRPEQEEALEYVQAVANRPGMAMAMSFEPGDIQFLNNHVLLHARKAYTDHPDPERQRHLLRMWIGYPPDRARPLSPALDEHVELVKAGGIPLKASAT